MSGWDDKTPALLREARQNLKKAGALLLTPTPESLDGARPLLDNAIRSLEQLEGLVRLEPERAAHALGLPLAELRTELARYSALLDSAAAFHLGWARLLNTVLSGYTPRGEFRPLEPGHRLSLQG